MIAKRRSFFFTPLSIALLMIGVTSCIARPRAPVAIPTAPSPAVATLMAMTPPQVSARLVSPDGQWRAEVVNYACTELAEEGQVRYEQLKLLAVATNQQTVLTHQQINCGGLGAFGLAPLCWSADSQRLYFTDAREGVPDGAGDWQRPIWQFEQSTGQIQPYTGTVQARETALPLPMACF